MSREYGLIALVPAGASSEKISGKDNYLFTSQSGPIEKNKIKYR